MQFLNTTKVVTSFNIDVSQARRDSSGYCAFRPALLTRKPCVLAWLIDTYLAQVILLDFSMHFFVVRKVLFLQNQSSLAVDQSFTRQGLVSTIAA